MISARPSMFIASIALIFINLPAMAAPAAPLLDFNGAYTLSLNGVPFGEAVVRAKEEEGPFSAEGRVRATGLAGMIAPFDGSAITKGTRKDSGPLAKHYLANYLSRGKPKRVEMYYGPKGQLYQKNIEPAEPLGKRPEVSEKKLRNASNPMTYLLNVRGALQAAQSAGKDSFSVMLFDGSRLMETRYTLTGKKTMKINGKKQPVLGTTMMRVPVDGYTAKELKRVIQPIQIFFSDDEKRIPLLMQVEFALGTASATLTRTCEGEAICPFSGEKAIKQASK